MKEIEEALAMLGLSKNETKAYIALVKYGQLSALECSQTTGIHRSNCYDSLKSLLEKGFVSQIVDGSRMVFIAREPEVLQEYMREQEKELDSAVRELNELSSKLEGKQGVTISTGLFSVKQSFNSCLFCDSPVEVYGLTKNILERLGEGYFYELERSSKINKVHYKVICNFHDDKVCEKSKKIDFLELRSLPEKFDGNVVTVLGGGKITLFVFSELPLVIEIKNEEIYASYKNYFEILWKKARS